MKKRILPLCLALCMASTLMLPVRAISTTELEEKITNILEQENERLQLEAEQRRQEQAMARREAYTQKIEAICRGEPVSVSEIEPLSSNRTYTIFIENHIQKIETASESTAELEMELLLKDMMGLAYGMRAEGAVPAELEQLLWNLENLCAEKTTETARLVERACTALREGFGIKRAEILPVGGNAGLTGFDDVPKNHWAYPYIMTIVNAGGMNGTKEPINGIGHFEPDDVVTLDQFLAVLVRLAASDKLVPARAGEHWAATYYRTAKELGWLHFEGSNIGFSEELDEIVTENDMDSLLDSMMRRDTMAHYLVAAAQETGEQLPYVEELPFEDNEYITSKRSVSMCYAAGLLEGSNGRFRPSASVTRAELAAICCRLMNYMDRRKPLLTSDPIFVHDNFYKYVSEDGYTVDDPGGKNHGKIRVIHARPFDFEAMSMVRVGEDEKGMYLEATAPVLPDAIGRDVGFSYSSTLYRENSFFASEMLSLGLKQGETKRVYYISNSREGDYVHAGEVVDITVSVSTNSTVSHIISYSIPGYIAERENTEPLASYSDYFDTDPIWIWK